MGSTRMKSTRVRRRTRQVFVITKGQKHIGVVHGFVFDWSPDKTAALVWGFTPFCKAKGERCSKSHLREFAVKDLLCREKAEVMLGLPDDARRLSGLNESESDEVFKKIRQLLS